MGKYANMILVDEQGRILDALKRIPPFENNRRTIHPGALYQLPAPHTGKQDPYHYEKIDPSESFTKQFHGFSPLLSREVQYRMAQGENFDEILERDKTSLDIFWLKDKSLADLDNLPAPDELAADIIENLQSALESFQELMRQLKKND